MCFWNCQGVGHPRFPSFVREYTREFSLDFVYLKCVLAVVEQILLLED